VETLRTEKDFSMGTAMIGSAVLVVIMFLFLYLKPVPGAQVTLLQNLAASVLIVVFGFLFVTVSSRIVGLIGSSANPISGMTIATLMATSAIFLVEGWTTPAFGALAITIGGVVCIASAEAGDTSQDLKTGFSGRLHAAFAALRLPHRHSGLHLRHRRNPPTNEHRRAGIQSSPAGMESLCATRRRRRPEGSGPQRAVPRYQRGQDQDHSPQKRVCAF